MSPMGVATSSQTAGAAARAALRRCLLAGNYAVCKGVDNRDFARRVSSRYRIDPLFPAHRESGRAKGVGCDFPDSDICGGLA